MLKTKYVLISILAIWTLLSCSDEVDLANDMIGTWSAQSVMQSNCNDPGDNIAQVTPDAEGCIDFDFNIVCNVRLIISDDGKAESQFVDVDGEADAIGFTYTINDSNDIATFENNTELATVELRNGNLIWTQDEGDGCVFVFEFSR